MPHSAGPEDGQVPGHDKAIGITSQQALIRADEGGGVDRGLVATKNRLWLGRSLSSRHWRGKPSITRRFDRCRASRKRPWRCSPSKPALDASLMLPNSFLVSIGAGSRQLDPPALQKFSDIELLPYVHGFASGSAGHSPAACSFLHNNDAL